jgi:hypothetical protein
MVSAKDIQKARRMALRKRAASACESCKSAKSKCNDYRPCSRCVRNDNNETCVPSSQSESEIRHGAAPVVTGALVNSQDISAATYQDSSFRYDGQHLDDSSAVPTLRKFEQANIVNPIKRQRISDHVRTPSFEYSRFFSGEQYGPQLGSEASMPLSVDMGRVPPLLAAWETQPALSALINGYDRPIQRCPPYHPAFGPAAETTLPTLPTLLPPSIFAFGANLPAMPSSFGISNPPPSPATDYVRLQCQLLLAGMLHG